MKHILLLASLFSLVAGSAQTISRHAGLVKGQQLEQLNKVTVNVTQEMMGQSMEIKVNSDIINLFDVKDQHAAGFSVSNTMKRVVMTMDMMGQPMNFDSDKKEDMDSQMGKMYKEHLNKEQHYTLNSTGLITAIKADADKKAAGGMMDNVLSGVMEGEKVGAVLAIIANIPDKGAQKGDTWTDSLGNGKNTTVTTYTLQDIRGNTGIISLVAELALDQEIEQQGMKMQMAMKGTTIGEYSFDTATGLVTSKKATTKSTGNIEIMGQEIPVTMETVLTTTISKK